MRRSLVLALWLMFSTSAAVADIDESAYEAVGAVRSDQERQRLHQQFAAEAEFERLRREAEDAAAAKLRAEELAREASRPYPERLTRQHCTVRHPADNYSSKHHTWLTWRLIVARMVWLNEAPIPPEAQALIADHLAATYPARGEERVVEYGSADPDPDFAGRHGLGRQALVGAPQHNRKETSCRLNTGAMCAFAV